MLVNVNQGARQGDVFVASVLCYHVVKKNLAI